MIHLTTFFALLVGGMEAIQPAAAGVLARTNLKLQTFQRRQTNSPPIPPGCTITCAPVATLIGSLGNCTATECCVTTFETSFFNCLGCAEAAANVTDFTSAQMTVDELYDDCAGLGIKLPVLTFPGQNASRPLSSVVLASSSQITVSTTPSQSVVQSTIGPLTTIGSSTAPAGTQATTTSNTPTPSPTSSFGTRSAEMSLFTVAVMLGAWFYFGV